MHTFILIRLLLYAYVNTVSSTLWIKKKVGLLIWKSANSYCNVYKVKINNFDA